jgi:hypothetical protein
MKWRHILRLPRGGAALFIEAEAYLKAASRGGLHCSLKWKLQPYEARGTEELLRDMHAVVIQEGCIVN